MTKLSKKLLGLFLAICMLASLFTCLTAMTASAESTDMIVWNGAPAYSRLLYRPDTGIFEAGTKYVLSFDIELTDITEENEPYFWRVYYANESGFVRIPHADFDITKTELTNGYHYDVKFTVPDDCRDYNNILLKFGDTGSNGYEQTMKLANLDLWSLDGEDNEVSQIELSIPATVDDIQQVTDTNQKNNGVHGAWVCPKDYLKNITVEPQNGYFDPVSSNPGDYTGPEIDPETGEVIIPAHYHTGGTATCHSKAICTVCSVEYGEFDANNHDGGTEVRDAVDATATEDGYTGDTYCLGCGALIAAGEVIPATGGGEQPASTDMIVWNGAPAYSRMLYRPDTGKFEAGTKYVLSFDMELTDVAEENEPYFWRVYYANESGFVRIPHADFDITKTELTNGYHYDVKFTVPDDCRDYNNILLKFGDTGANGYEQTMKLANLDLWSLDGEDNEVSQVVLSIPATIDDVYQTNDTNEKGNGVHGKWVCPINYLKNITIEPQNGYFDPKVEPSNNMFVVESTAGYPDVAYLSTSDVQFVPGEQYTFTCKFVATGGFEYTEANLKNLFVIRGTNADDNGVKPMWDGMTDFSMNYDADAKMLTVTFTASDDTNRNRELTPGSNCYILVGLGDRNASFRGAGYTFYFADPSLVVGSTGVDILADCPIDEEHYVPDGQHTANKGKWAFWDNGSTVSIEDKGNTFGDGEEPGECEHTGGTATCHSKAVCTLCGEEYGEFDANNHDGGTEVRDAKEATETEEGYTGDTYCLGCGEKIADGSVIPVKVTSTKMIHFVAGDDGYQTLIYKIGGNVAAGKYRFTIDEYAATGVKSTVRLFVNGSAYTTAVERNVNDLDTENNKRVSEFMLYGAKQDGMVVLIGNYGDGDNMETYYRNPQLYLLDEHDNPVGENLVADFAEDNIVFAYNTSRANAEVDKWTALNWTADRVKLEDVKNSLFDGIDYTPGDINGDGEVDNKDLTRLFQFLSNWEVEVNEDALDVNGDGSVDNKDLTRLFQYLSNWEVEIF